MHVNAYLYSDLVRYNKVAITTQAQYRTHILAAIKALVIADPKLFIPLIPGLVAYAQLGSDQREAVEMIFTWAWTHLKGGAFDGHAFKHILADAGVVGVALQDVTARNEP